MHNVSKVSVSLFSAVMILALLVFSSESRGQQPVKDINTGPFQLWKGTDPSPARPFSYLDVGFLRLGGWTWFRGNTPVTGTELFRTNGTKTELVKDIYPGSDGSNPADLTLIGDKFYFSAEDPLHGRELWVSDGTAKGTRLLGDFVSGPASSKPKGVAGLSKGRVLYVLTAWSVRGLWVTDGTPTGTKAASQECPAV